MVDLMLEVEYNDEFDENAYQLINYILNNMRHIESYTIVDKHNFIGSFQTCYDEHRRNIYTINIITNNNSVGLSFDKRGYGFRITRYHHYDDDSKNIPNIELYKYLLIYIHKSASRILIPSFEIDVRRLRKLYGKHFYDGEKLFA